MWNFQINCIFDKLLKTNMISVKKAGKSRNSTSINEKSTVNIWKLPSMNVTAN